jgi:hypothetical protein
MIEEVHKRGGTNNCNDRSTSTGTNLKYVVPF